MITSLARNAPLEFLTRMRYFAANTPKNLQFFGDPNGGFHRMTFYIFAKRHCILS